MFEQFSGFYLLIFLLVLGFVMGRLAERRHWRSMRKREAELKDLKIFSHRNLPDARRIDGGTMVTGSVVIGQDYYLGFASAIKQLFGGRIKSYEGLLERARLEATLRMKEEARALGAKAVYNVKFSTTNISARDTQHKMTGVEVMAYGSAVSY